MNENTSKKGFKNESCDCNKESISSMVSVRENEIRILDDAFKALVELRKIYPSEMDKHIEELLQQISADKVTTRAGIAMLQKGCIMNFGHEWKYVGSGHNTKYYTCSICNASKSE